MFVTMANFRPATYTYVPYSPHSPLVSHPLTAGNYDTWSRAMQLAITARDMFGFAEGTTPRPDDGSDPVLLASWDWRNNLVKSWLLKSISEDIAATVIHFSSAADIWSHLRDLFGNRHPLTSNCARSDDDWECPSCGNDNLSFRTTCNMCDYTQPFTEGHNSESAITPLQVPQGFSSSAPHVGSSSSSSMYPGVQPYGSSLFTGPSIPPHGVPFYGQSAYYYDYTSHLSALHLSGGTPYSSGSMMGDGGICGLPQQVDWHGLGMPIGPRTTVSSKTLNSIVANLQTCNCTPPALVGGLPQVSKSGKKSKRKKFPEGSWRCEECNYINYPRRTKCNGCGCGADKPAKSSKSPSSALDQSDQ